MFSACSVKRILIASLLVSLLPLPSIANGDSQCEMHLVYRPLEQSSNELSLKNYDGTKWSEPKTVHSTSSSFSYSSTIASDVDGNLVVVWVEASGVSNQLMYRVKARSGNWLGAAVELTSFEGEKTTPVLIRSVSGQVYLAWVSDQNDFDDVFMSRWSFADGWSAPEVLSSDNPFPDISPNFEYVEQADGRYELVLSWQARSENGVYASEQYTVEIDLGLNLDQQRISDYCENELSAASLPSNIEEGFLHRPQLVLDSYRPVRNR